jgi:hypothetical protein
LFCFAVAKKELGKNNTITAVFLNRRDLEAFLPPGLEIFLKSTKISWFLIKKVTGIEHNIKRVHRIEEIQAKAACSLNFGGKNWDKNLNLWGTGTVN